MIANSKIREHMDVLGADGAHVGTVDHLEGEERIKLTKDDSTDGQHHFIPLDWVDHVDQHVHLNVSAEEAMGEWEDGDELELEDEDEDAEPASADADVAEEEEDWAERS